MKTTSMAMVRMTLRTALSLTAVGAIALTAVGGAAADEQHRALSPGNLLVSRSEYLPADIEPNVTVLPPGCLSGCATASSGGAYPFVFNNDLIDGSFGITSPILLDQVTPAGALIDTLRVPTDKLVTSFSSKSELALNLSTSGRHVTFMGYAAPVDALDVSNSNTPGAVDPTNPVTGADYRAVATLGRWGGLSFTETNAYSGNNGRAAIYNDADGQKLIYTAGNAGNGSSPQPDGVIQGAGAQLIVPSDRPEADQSPGTPTPVASFNVTQLGDPADKIGKDDNFRGLTISDHVLYYTKGSGGNGIDTVYFVDTTGGACPGGTGIPAPGAALPSSALSYDAAALQTSGLPSNMCVLRGFPTKLAKSDGVSFFPFGIWFANAHTVYVADEGDGTPTYSTALREYTDAASQTAAGLQKWVFDTGSESWKLAYTLQDGLALGQPYAVPGYPTGNNPASDLPWAPATDGLRNITGRVNRDGTATIWAVTSTVSGSGDQGADPNQLVSITDRLGAVSPGAESFRTVREPRYGQVVRGVAFTPGS